MAKKTKTPTATPPATTTPQAAAPAAAATATPALAPFRVFYSWQSDLPNNRNRGFIEDALEKAAKEFKKKTGVEMIVDEATRDETGATHIPDAILRKIRKSEYFVADLTPVAENDKRKLPNPNVCIELGYAVAELGWERVGMVFNSAFGDFPGSLPFDAEKRRAFSYTVADTIVPADKTKEKQGLMSKLTADLVAVHQKQPVKARLLGGTTPEELAREKDRVQLERFLRVFSPPFVNSFIDNLSNRRARLAMLRDTENDGLIQDFSFRIRNQDLVALVGKLHSHFSFFFDAVAMRSKPSRGGYDKLMIPPEMADNFDGRLQNLADDYRSLLDRAEELFPEIDLTALEGRQEPSS